MATDAKNNIASLPLTLDWGTSVTDNLSSPTDKDYFKLPQVDKASKVTLDFTGLSSSASNNEFTIAIVNESDTNIASTTKGLSTTLTAQILAT